MAEVLATVTTVFIARSVTGPIRNLATATRTIARTGDLSHGVTVDMVVDDILASVPVP